MLALQKDKSKEAAAFVTKNGKGFVAPMGENFIDDSTTYDLYIRQQGTRDT
jgi:hypothetical protein